MIGSRAVGLGQRSTAGRHDEQRRATGIREAALRAALAAADLTLTVGADGIAIATPDGRPLIAANSEAGTLALPGVTVTAREDGQVYDTVDHDTWPHSPDLLLAQQAAFVGVRVWHLPSGGCTVTAPGSFAWPSENAELAHPATLVDERDAWMWPFDPFFTHGDAGDAGTSSAWVTDYPALLSGSPVALTTRPVHGDRRQRLAAALQRSAADAGVALSRLPGDAHLWEVSRDGRALGVAELDPAGRPRVQLTSRAAHAGVGTRWMRDDQLKPVPWPDVFPADCPDAGAIHTTATWAAPHR